MLTNLLKIRTLLIGIACFLISLILSTTTLACKYTVRDVAFVALVDKEYRLDLFLDATTSERVATRLTTAAQKTVAESNISLHVVRVGVQDEDNTKVQMRLKTLEIDSFPAAVLVAPDQRSREILLPPDLLNHPEQIKAALATTINSPKTTQIMTRIINAHSIVLIIKSANLEQNQRALKIASGAVAKIKKSLIHLAKPIDVPPEILTLSLTEAKREALLLWSLGIDVQTVQNTQIALLFGRGRILGTVLDVEEISETDITRRLTVAGLDCECELDRSWMQSQMIPHCWNENDESMAANVLGFDPGHPMTKAEISRILSRGPSNQALRSQKSGGLPDLDTMLPGLQIIDLNFDEELEDEPADNQSAAILQANKNRTPSRNDLPLHNADNNISTNKQSANKTATTTQQKQSLVSFTTITILGIALISFIGGAFVIVSNRCDR